MKVKKVMKEEKVVFKVFEKKYFTVTLSKSDGTVLRQVKILPGEEVHIKC